MMRKPRVKNKSSSHGILLLKIISMFLSMTVMMLDSSQILSTLTPAEYYFFMLIKTMAACSFNCCMISFGYEQYQQPWSLLRIISLWTIIGFYAKTTATILGIFLPEQVGFIDWLKAMFPIVTNYYWFLVNYLAILLLQPLLNAAVQTVAKRTTQVILIGLTLCACGTTLLTTNTFGINNGQSLLWMILMYFVGCYIRKYRAWSKLDGAGLLVIASVLIVALWTVGIFWDLASQDNHFNEWIFLQPTAPTSIIIGVLLFVAFKQLKVPNKNKTPLKIIRNLHIGPYLLCMNPLILEHIIPQLFTNSSVNSILQIMCLFGIIIACYATGLIVEVVRSSIFQRFNILRNTFKAMSKIKKKIETIQAAPIEHKDDDWDTIGIKIGKTVEAMCNDMQIYKDFGIENTVNPQLKLRPMVYTVNTIHSKKSSFVEQGTATMTFKKAQ